MADEQNEQPKQGVGATILIVIGVLWMALTGLCTVSLVVSSALEGTGLVQQENPSFLLLAAFMAIPGGLVCLSPGFLIWLYARRDHTIGAAKRVMAVSAIWVVATILFVIGLTAVTLINHPEAPIEKVRNLLWEPYLLCGGFAFAGMFVWTLSWASAHEQAKLRSRKRPHVS